MDDFFYINIKTLLLRMKTPEIKKLVERYTLAQLQEAELAICDEQATNRKVFIKNILI